MVKGVKTFMSFVEKIVTVLFAISVVLVICQVFWRYVLVDPITWSSQISRGLFCWMVYLAIPCLFNRNVLMSFDLIQDALKPMAHAVLKLFFRVVGLFFSGAWFYFSYLLCTSNTTVGKAFPGELPFIKQLPKNALYTAQPVCCVLLVLVLISQMVEIVGEMKAIKNGKEAK